MGPFAESRSRAARAALLAALALAAACGATSGAAGKASAPKAKPPELDRQSSQKLRDFETLYRKHGGKLDEREQLELEEKRIELCARPDTAYWLARLFIYDAVVALDRGDTATGIVRLTEEPTMLERALLQLQAMGATAVPSVRDALLRHEHADRRQLGVRVLQAIGPAAVPDLLPLLEAGEVPLRSAVVEALGAMGSDEKARAGIERATRDEHFAVRGAAWTALARTGPATLPQLCQALAADPDPYVRRTIAKALGGFTAPEAEQALRAYRTRCIEQRDARGIEAADDALRTRPKG